jgi:hypothetical protein
MKRFLPGLLLAGALACAGAARGDTLGDVFYIDMENHNATQPASVTSPQPIYGNPAAPFINSLITPGNPNAAQVSYAPNYYSVGASVHPSEPNYIWQEAGTNFGVNFDNDPYKAPTGRTNVFGSPNLSGLLQQKYGANGWRAYAEDMQFSSALPGAPVSSASGTNPAYTNPYNGSHQFDYAVKHVGPLFFAATNGGSLTAPNNTASNPEAAFYAPLTQLSGDLAANNVARYTLITPDQFNDMHTSLSGGFTDPRTGIHYTGDAANIAQGDYFLSVIVPQIMASQAYKNNGAIVLWWDETENGDSTAFTLPEIVISPLARGNAYASPLSFTHSSDLKTLEELFGVFDPNTGAFLGGANSPNTSDLSDLFLPGAIIPEPTSFGLFALGAAALGGWRWLRRRKVARTSPCFFPGKLPQSRPA